MVSGRGELTPKDLEYRKIISENIKNLLFSGNVKQVDLSRGTKIPTSTLTGYVKGTSLPIPRNVQKIADFFGVMKSDIDPRFKINDFEDNHDIKNVIDKRGRAELSPKEIQIRNTIADNLNKLKTKYGLTQLELSEKADIPQNTLSRYLNAKSTPKEIYLKKLADFFNVPISEIDPRLDTTLTTTHSDIIQAVTDTMLQLTRPRQETVLSVALKELEMQKTKKEN